MGRSLAFFTVDLRALKRFVASTLLFLLLALNLGAGRSTVVVSAIGYDPEYNPCLGYTMNPEFTEYVTVPFNTHNVPMTAPSTSVTPQIYQIMGAAYSITWEYIANGTCITISGRSSSAPSNITLNVQPTAAPIAIRSVAVSVFRDVLGFVTCENGERGVINYPNATITGLSPRASLNGSSVAPVVLLTTSIPPIPSSSPVQTDVSPVSATDSISQSPLSLSARVAVGVVVPIIASISLLLGIIYLKRHQRRKRSWTAQKEENTGDPADNSQPYLQQKAELEAEEKRRLELEASEMRHEIDEDHEIYEAPGEGVRNELDTHSRPGLRSLYAMHELRGEEFSKELEP